MKYVDFTGYNSPFSWRYGTEEMRKIFSEQHKYELWRKIWLALAQVEHEAGLVSQKELSDLKKHQHNLDIKRILEIEESVRHEMIAAIREFAEKATIGAGKIHLGATSQDLIDNADMLRMKEALEIVEKRLLTALSLLGEKIKQYARTPCMGFTHIQPAEPTTVGYRLSLYAQDLLIDLDLLRFIRTQIKGKGMKGAVGTSASYTSLLKGKKMSAAQMEEKVMRLLNLEPVLISTQVYTRKFDYLLLSLNASIGQSFAKFAGDLRILQSPPFGEWAEPFGEKHVGSSAMPFKKNPEAAEKICSLARYINHLPPVAQENASLSYLERTLDDSANKRIIISESFLALDEILKTAVKILTGFVVNEKRVNHNLLQYAPFSATELILMESVKKGASRQKMHEILREISLKAWNAMQLGNANLMTDLLIQNTEIAKYLTKNEVEKLLDVTAHVGNAPERALQLVKRINKVVKLSS